MNVILVATGTVNHRSAFFLLAEYKLRRMDVLMLLLPTQSAYKTIKPPFHFAHHIQNPAVLQ